LNPFNFHHALRGNRGSVPKENIGGFGPQLK